MSDPIKFARVLRPRSVAIVLAGAVGFAVAAFGGLAFAKTFTLNVAKNAKVVNFNTHAATHQTIVTTSSGAALYTLSGETPHHLKCTSSQCLSFWPPLKAKSAKSLSKATGIKGKLGVIHRKGFTQVTLGGHPLYRFAPDKQKRVATGQDVMNFGGTWHVVTASSHTTSSSSTTTGSTTTTPGYY
jgi:predicted lipoprotein with Yx(FWY)xxD motif